MRAPFKALRSTGLAIFLIAYLAAASVAASFLPQGREAGYYRGSMPAPIAELAIRTGFTDFYASPAFLGPALLFFSNLSSCAAYRLAKELRKERKKRRHGPDLIHLGLVLLIAAAVAGEAVQRLKPEETRGFVRLAPGEAVRLSGNRILALVSLREEDYPDGRPEDWVSVVRVTEGDRLLVADREIRVNRPLRLGGLSIRQASFQTAGVLGLRAPSGETRDLVEGESLALSSGSVELTSVDLGAGKAFFREAAKPGESAEARRFELGPGSALGDFTVVGLRAEELSGLVASYDPLYPAVLASFAVTILGLFVTFAQKLKGGKLE